jgi:outer membrane receptor protein involved in Fe transport
MKHWSAYLCSTAAIAAAWSVPALAASLDAPKSFDIPAQSLDTALLAYSRQSGLQVVSSSPAIARKATSGVQGVKTPREALQALLRGSELSFVSAGDRTVTIVNRPAEAARPGVTRIVAETVVMQAGAPAATAGATVAPPPPPPADEVLGEVVVTATRQSDTVNRVPLSVTAVTQRTLDQQGVKNVQDLARTVPGVTFRRSGGEANPTVTIRGIGSALGSPTTGIYLDDVAIQKRDTNGAYSGNGSPFPQLFDLERVEVLRGPQGTLYGGSAQGGAVRFITPTPSLTRYSSYARTEVSHVEGGGTSYEAGVAVGGPIVQDKLGFRVSAWGRHTAGYLDHVSLFTGKEFAKDTNKRNAAAYRITLLWQPFEGLRITPAVYWGKEHFADTDTFSENIPELTFRSGVFTNQGTTQSGVRYDFPNTTFTGGTFGPFNWLGRDKSYVGFYPDMTSTPTLVQSPRDGKLFVPSLTLDYDAASWLSIKSITAVTYDLSKGYNGSGLGGHRNTVFPNVTNPQFVTAASITAATPNGTAIPGGVGNTLIFIPGYTQRYTEGHYYFQRNGFSQEIRFSTPADRPLSIVAGLFFSNQRYHLRLEEPGNEEQSAIWLRGVGEEWFMGTTNLLNDGKGTPAQVGVAGLHAYRAQYFRDREKAAFGEVSYRFLEKFKATAGVRVAEIEVDYLQYTNGSVFGNTGGFVGSPAPPTIVTNPNQGHPFANQPGDPTFNIITGAQKERPISPKVGLSYQATERNLFYVTYSTGYRAGGINQPAPPGNCAPTLAALGITTTPTEYASDKIASYEGGAKLRLFNRLQVNTSVFYIDWKNPQITQRLTQCGHTYVDNAGKAHSKGVDVEATGRFGPITLSGSVAYTNAEYDETVMTKVPAGVTPQVVVSKGDELGAPKWQATFSAQYDFSLFSRNAYIRADAQYSGRYLRTPGPASFSYSPLVYRGAPTTFVTARAGLNFGRIDASIFVTNLTDEESRLNVGNTPPSLAVTGSTYRPREIGLQLTYRQ